MRFIDADLNRQFAASSSSTSTSSAAPSQPGALTPSGSSESARAAALRQEFAALGIDFVMDLHSTNADVGLVAMVPAGEANVTGMRVAAALASARPGRGVRVTGTDLGLLQNWSVDAAAPAGLSIEVGPLPHGTLSSGLLEATRTLVSDALDMISARNQALLGAAAASGASLQSDACIVPAAAAPDLILRPGPCPQQEIFTHVASVAYPPPGPRGDRWLVHPTLEGPNWRPIADGDAAFISADGAGSTLPFAAPRAPRGMGGSEAVPVEGLHTLFVNEAAYQASGIAFAVYKREYKIVY